jgi:catechol 2,3-dioxygenase-like lactoylglutathione lyase family enzyme
MTIRTLTLDVPNFDKAMHFYDELLGPLGYEKTAHYVKDSVQFAEWEIPGGGGLKLSILKGEERMFGPVNLGLEVATRADVADLYALGIAVGGESGSKPYLAPVPGGRARYFAELFDPAGNRVWIVSEE